MMKQVDNKVICIDARLWGIGHTGPGRYTQNLLRNLPDEPGVEIVVIVSREHAQEPELSRFRKIVTRHHPYSLMSQLEMAEILYRENPDLFHATHFTIPVLWFGRIVVTIHDLIKHYSRGSSTTTRQPLLYWFKYLGYLAVVRIAVWRASHIIVPSRYWKQILKDKYSLPESKISVTYEAVDPSFLKTKSEKISLPFTGPFVVHTGNLYPHKNVPTLISAVNKFNGRIKLALVCARSVFASRLPASPHVYFLGRLTDSQLRAVYQKAIAYIFPSFIEGFGLPGLEAMAVGLPVIASDSSCLPEIYGSAAVYFDPHDSGQLSRLINQMSQDKNLRRRLVANGYRQVQKYLWSKLGRQTWQIYLDALH